MSAGAGAVHTRLAALLRHGTSVAAVVTTLGMLTAYTSYDRLAAAVTVSGLLMFALLPVGGLLVTARHFAAGRDRTYLALTVAVLALIAANVVVGVFR